MRLISGGITAPKGFWAAGIHCGIKYKNPDLALIFSKPDAVACGVFTQNSVQAAPVKLTKTHLRDKQAQAIIINSGNANCCTGRAGLKDAREICLTLAKKLGLRVEEVLVSSTGIIGRRLPVARITKKIGQLVNCLSRANGPQAARAILTTDTKIKHVAVEIMIGKTKVRLAGMAKGAGMIQPNLATMLAFITTDAKIDKHRLNQAFKTAVNNSFNLISVDGQMSTNDMVIIMANGSAANPPMGAKDLEVFQRALNFICLTLAKMIVRDGEGATKFVTIQVVGAKDARGAKKVGLAIANSLLVKTAIFGQNANWGRIASCCGAVEPAIKQEGLDIYLGRIKVLQKGTACMPSRQQLSRVFKNKEILIKVNLGLGQASAQVFSCDLSDKYVKINSEY